MTMRDFKQVQAFFDYANERERIRISRERGDPYPWTTDSIFNAYRFCNVNREHDTVTRWWRTWSTDNLRPEQMLLATVLFRWFNRVSTGEAIFCQRDMFAGGRTAWEVLWEHTQDGNYVRGVNSIRTAVRAALPKGPWVTGSYIIKGYDGMDKLAGVTKAFQEFCDRKVPLPGHAVTPGWSMLSLWMGEHPGLISLESTWGWLKQHAFLGPFLSYEVVCDLYHTPLLAGARDINTWANPGPGAERGLNRIHSRDLKQRVPRAQQIAEMREIFSHVGAFWSHVGWEWDMRTVEHTLCEADKYWRVQQGQGRPRQVFRAK